MNSPAFSSQQPIAQGWYWYRETPTSNPYPVKVFGPGGPTRYVWPVNDRMRNIETKDIIECKGEFAGPIYPPGVIRVEEALRDLLKKYQAKKGLLPKVK